METSSSKKFFGMNENNLEKLSKTEPRKSKNNEFKLPKINSKET